MPSTRLLTDLVLGSWTSASVLDLLGGSDSAGSAQRLVGTGLLAAAPTAWTGWAEWSAAGPRDQRVGLVHAVTNGVAIGVYAASWLTRRRGRHTAGAGLALAGAAVSGVGAYLGGHLAEGRKVATRHPAYDEATAEPDPSVSPLETFGSGTTPARPSTMVGGRLVGPPPVVEEGQP